LHELTNFAGTLRGLKTITSGPKAGGQSRSEEDELMHRRSPGGEGLVFLYASVKRMHKSIFGDLKGVEQDPICGT
uniref:Sensor histidine kinase n=1 Tax=Hydatigena taeniaeformis TaxID=6205 RepID=A0A0R3WSS3_HYDTA